LFESDLDYLNMYNVNMKKQFQHFNV